MEKIILARQMDLLNEIIISEELSVVMEEVGNAHRGRFAYVDAHISGIDDPKCTTVGISDKWFISLPRYDLYLLRLASEVSKVEFLPFIERLDSALLSEMRIKYQKDDLTELFMTAMNSILTSCKKTQDHDRSDGFRIGHDYCYAYAQVCGMDVKLHLVTELDSNRHKRPIRIDGHMVVESVMLPYFLINRRDHQKAIYKPTDSKALTLMKNAIKDAAKVPEWNELSLGKRNFSYLSLDSQVIYGKVQDLTGALKNTELADFFHYVCNLNTNVMDLFISEARVFVDSKK